ncbi:hypothetical protein FG386_000273 [Cryptosporidium ryanae]|uniref:uncharacterized protein n=1 Tax=Cryptosporidium ryanae TaxID=515981 RepID=UPI00351A4FDA|nr:hypothetical protein FG386_000273 [Cryptosporidium ryanae]
MLNDLFSLKDIAIYSIKYFQELVQDLKLDNTDCLPRKNVEEFIRKTIKEDIKSTLDQSSFRWFKSDYVSFIEFWRLFEDLLQLNNKIENGTSEEFEGIISGMIHLRNKIIDKSASETKLLDLNNVSHFFSGSKLFSKISLREIRQIMQEIVSDNNQSDITSAYWSDVLNQVSNETNLDILLDITDISNSILQWLEEFLITPEFSGTETANNLLTRIITLKDIKTNNLTDNEETVKFLNTEQKKKLSELISEEKNKTDTDYDNKSMKNLNNELLESLPWKGQTMFSNFRELQMSLQYLLERVSLVSSGEIGEFSKRDQLSIRKISHMITELEDFLYHQFDIIQKERNTFHTIEMENSRLKKQLRNISEELNDKKIELQDSISQKDKFEKEIEYYLLQKSKLSADVIRLRNENRVLENKYEETLSKLNKIIEEYMVLKDEYTLLRSELDLKNEQSTFAVLDENLPLKDKTAEDKKKGYSRSQAGELKTNKYPCSNINTFYYKSITNYSSKIKESYSKVNFELPATITSLPEFLETEANYPVKSQSNQLEKFYFPISSIGKLRTVEVVPTIFEKYGTDASINNQISRKVNMSEINSLKDRKCEKINK